jgi:hypothetical protein
VLLGFRLLRLLLLDLPVLVVDHLDDFRLVAVGQQVVRGVDVLQTLPVVGSSLVVNELILLLDLDREDRHAVDQLLSVRSVVFWEVHIHKAGQGVAVGTKPHHSVFVSVAIYDLFLHASPFVPRTNILTLLSVNGVTAQDASLLLSIELLNGGFLLLLNASLVLGLHFPDLRVMILLKGLVLLHDAVHVALIHINHDHLLTLFQGFILILEA